MDDTRLTLHEARGSLNDLNDKLAGKEGETWLAALKRFLRKENPWPVDFPVWKTIKLGTGLKTADDFCQALAAARVRVGSRARDIMNKPAFTAAIEETEVDLVAASVAELGFPEGATWTEINKRAKERGLALCPAEVGPQLRLQYPDQPMGERRLIAMEPITDSDGDIRVFNVGHDDDDGCWLGTDYDNPGHRCGAGYRWVFLRRK
ncbi:MAG: hypothetical protein PHW53_00940 [Patescibacteria group bacterium]|nr:hypothetical protein [Patescibacteria group bacterium]